MQVFFYFLQWTEDFIVYNKVTLNVCVHKAKYKYHVEMTTSNSSALSTETLLSSTLHILLRFFSVLALH